MRECVATCRVSGVGYLLVQLSLYSWKLVVLGVEVISSLRYSFTSHYAPKLLAILLKTMKSGGNGDSAGIVHLKNVTRWEELEGFCLAVIGVHIVLQHPHFNVRDAGLHLSEGSWPSKVI